MFCLLVVLVKLSLLAKWLAGKTPLRKPNRGEWIISIKSRQKSAYDFLGLLYCFIVYYVFVLSPAPTWYNYYPTVMALYSLFVLKVPLNTQQTTNIYMPDALPVAQPTMSAHSREKNVIYLWCECDIRRPVARLKIAIVSHHPAFLPTSLPPSPLYRMPRFRRRRRSPWKRSSMHIIRPSVCRGLLLPSPSRLCWSHWCFLTLPYGEGVLPPSAEASGGPNAHPRINR